VIKLDPENETAWRYHGTTTTLKAAGTDPKTKNELWNKALLDFRRSAELQPTVEYIGLDLLELEICLGKYKDAVGTFGEWWSRVQSPKNKLVCAWLGAIALILAGKPARRWVQLRDLLENDSIRLTAGDWTITEMDRYIRGTRQEDRDQFDSVIKIHELFLKHFSKS
jgi:hypothetical protein